MNITQYVKDHPWATGIIVIVGGFIFIMIFRGGGGSSSSGGVSGPSDAEIAANAQVSAAQISAQAQAAQAGAAVQAAQIGANVQLNSDNKAAEVAMRALEVQQSISNTQTAAEQQVALQSIYQQSQRQWDILQQTGGMNSTAKESLLKSLAMGDYGSNSAPKQSNFANNVNAIGGAIGSVGKVFGSIFSDQRLKENIRFLGYNEKGVGVYEWNYKGSKKKHIGYIAQDVARSHPEAVSVDSGTGYWKVNTLRLASI